MVLDGKNLTDIQHWRAEEYKMTVRPAHCESANVTCELIMGVVGKFSHSGIFLPSALVFSRRWYERRNVSLYLSGKKPVNISKMNELLLNPKISCKCYFYFKVDFLSENLCKCSEIILTGDGWFFSFQFLSFICFVIYCTFVNKETQQHFQCHCQKKPFLLSSYFVLAYLILA